MKTDENRDRDQLAVWGERIALGTAVLLTAKGEFDLAVMAHFAVWIAWLYPLMLDVYVITAFHKRRWLDVAISLALMLFSQIAVHLVPVFITDGEQVPWGLVMAVACIAPIVVVRVKALTGKTREEIEAAKRDDQFAADARKARAEAADADRKRAEAEAALEAEERKRAEAEETARAEAELRRKAEERADAEAEARAEESHESEAEIARLIRHSEEVQASARDARAQAAEASDQAARVAGQLEEARLMAERAVADKMAAEQRFEALAESRQTLAEELAKSQQVIARLQQRAEAGARRQAEISAPPTRKKAPALPPSLPVDVPPVDGVSSATVARVISAFRRNPGGTRKEIAAAADTTDRTVRAVLNSIPVDHPALAIESADTDDRAAV
ncbi:hypothetical protein OG989_03970 [Micromonospora sp. NBC_01740]|uniref:hypothetical protein n=1 Tax=Micromonospora sp. NBC_01740 TaxID=2975986 RepID=UPI002E12314C|nr:hypothetical protein OG989_03970 [Micromonospora sp. NBC_01740]